MEVVCGLFYILKTADMGLCYANDRFFKKMPHDGWHKVRACSTCHGVMGAGMGLCSGKDDDI